MYVKIGLVESPLSASMTRVLAEQVTPQYIYVHTVRMHETLYCMICMYVRIFKKMYVHTY